MLGWGSLACKSMASFDEEPVSLLFSSSHSSSPSCSACWVEATLCSLWCSFVAFSYFLLFVFFLPNPGLPMACDRPLVTLYGVTSPSVHPPYPLTKSWPLPTRDPATPATPHRTKAEDEGTRGKNTTFYMWKKRNKKLSEMKSLSPSLISLFLSLYFFFVCSVQPYSVNEGQGC